MASITPKAHLAQLIILAMTLREDSWDVETHTYKLTTSQASEAACIADIGWEPIVSLLLYYGWNDAFDWASKFESEVTK